MFNDFPCIINKVAHTILFADDTNILVSLNAQNGLNSKLNLVMNCISKWFQNNQLVLNLNKTHMVKFTSPKTLVYPLHTAHNNEAHNVGENVKFLGTHLDCHLTWKQHSDNLVNKLNTICFMLRKLLPVVNEQVLRMVYFAHFHSQLGYGTRWFKYDRDKLRLVYTQIVPVIFEPPCIIFWGSSSSMRSVFVVQKRAIRIMLRLGPRSSCREGFKKLGILTVPCLHIYALMLFVVKNPNIYQTNNSVHNLKTRQQDKLHESSVRLSSIQKGAHYSSDTIFNQLPQIS
jgi:hypothetical protein